MTDSERSIQRLLATNPLREKVFRSAIQALRLPPGSHGLDVGCGIGLQTLLLAGAVGSGGYVAGIDIVPDFLTFGKNLAEKDGFSERIAFREGDMSNLPFAENTFDWAWSSDCLGYPAGEISSSLQELMRVVRPEGSIILLAWSSQQVLPGYPLLEARLNATCSASIPYLKAKSPELHFLRALRWFREAGLEEVKAQTLVGDVQAPLAEEERAALTSLLAMLWQEPAAEAPGETWTEYRRLCRPESADFILGIPDYYAFFTYTMFRGRVPAITNNAES